MQTTPVLQAGLDSGLLQNAAQLATIAGTLVLLGMLAAFGAFAYKSLRGGVEWPDDEDEGVQRAGDDEEWKYS